MVVADAPSTLKPGRVLAWICAGHFMSHFWLLTLPPLFPVLAARFNVTFVQLGLLLTLYNITYGVFQMPFGYLADKYGPRIVLVSGLLLNGSAFALCALAPTYWALLVLALLAGVGQSVFHPADYAILSATYGKERSGRPYSLHTFSGYVGSAVAPITVATINQVLGWRAALGIAGLAGVAIGLLIAGRLRIAITASTAAPAAAGMRKGSGPNRYIFSQAILLMFVFYAFTSMTSSGVQAFVPSSLTQLYGMSVSTANAALTSYLVALSVGVLLGGVIADRVANHARLIGAMFTAGMLLMFVLAVARLPLWLLFLILAIAGTFHGVVAPSRDRMVREVTPEGAAGKSFGFVSTGMSLGGMIAPLILGALLDLGYPSLIFWAIATFMLIAVLTTIAPRRGTAEVSA